MPVVLIPVHFDRDPINRTPSCRRSVVLRPFITNDFMTGVPAEPGSVQMPLQVSQFSIFLKNVYLIFSCSKVLNQIVRDISKLDGISRVLYDLTAKPPGTTEWE